MTSEANEADWPEAPPTDELVRRLAAAVCQLPDETSDEAWAIRHAMSALTSLSKRVADAQQAIAPVVEIVAKYQAAQVRDLEDDYLSFAWSDCEDDKEEEQAILGLCDFYALLSRENGEKETTNG